MIETFTQNDVLRYLYGETSHLESKKIKNALKWDADLAEFYLMARQQKSEIDNCLLEPSEKVLSAIMEHARHDNLQTVS